MRKTCVILGVCLAFGGAIAGDDDWVFDTSKRAAETTSSGSASLSSVFESRSVCALGSVATAVDSRCGDWQESEPTGLDSTKRGFCIIVR